MLRPLVEAAAAGNPDDAMPGLGLVLVAEGRGTERFGPGSGARACFSWSMECCPNLKHDGRTAICVTQQERGLRKRMLPPDPGPILSAPRAALRPEYREEFDRDYREALAEAGRTLDLEGICDTLEHGRMRSWITRDTQEHRRVVRRAVELLTGQQPPVG